MRIFLSVIVTILFFCCQVQAQKSLPATKTDTLASQQYFQVGKENYNRGNYEQALNELEESVKYNPKNWKAWTYKAFTEMKLERLEDAIRSANQSLSLNSQYIVPLKCKAECEKALGKNSQALEDFNKYISVDSTDDQIYVGRGSNFNVLEQYDKALEDFNRAIKLNPKSPNPHLRKSSSYFSLKKYRKAVEEANLFLKLKGSDERVYFNRGLSYVYLGEKEVDKADSAIADLNIYLQTNFKDALSYRFLGTAYNLKNDTLMAGRALRRAIELDPEDSESYSQWADGKLVAGDYKKAVELYQKSEKIVQKNSGKSYSIFYERLGLALAGSNDTLAALKTFEKGLQLYKDSKSLHATRFDVIFDKPKYDSLSFIDLNTLLRLYTDSTQKAFAYSCRSVLYFRHRNFVASQSDADYATQIAPDEPYPYLIRSSLNLLFILNLNDANKKNQLINMILSDMDKVISLDKTSWQAYIIKLVTLNVKGEKGKKMCEMLMKVKELGGVVTREMEDLFCKNKYPKNGKDVNIDFVIPPKLRK